jgi:hypothetical protein
LIHGVDILLQDDLLGSMGHFEIRQPAHMGFTPWRTARISDPTTKEERKQALFTSFLVAFGIFPCAGQISDGLVFGSGNVNSGKITRSMQTGKHQSIPAVIFNLFATRLGNPGRCDHLTFKALGSKVTVDLISTRTGFIHKVQSVAFTPMLHKNMRKLLLLSENIYELCQLSVRAGIHQM